MTRELAAVGGERQLVERAAPGVKTPFVSAVIDLDDGARVQANVVDCDPDPDHVSLGMKVKLTTYVVGADDNGVEAVAFGFAPLSRSSLVNLLLENSGFRVMKANLRRNA